MEDLDMLYERLCRELPGLELRREEPMSGHTTFRVGGPVSLMALPRSWEEAQIAVRLAAGLGITPFFLGNGSNLLVSDAGWKGFIIKTVDGLSRLEYDGDGLITADSGVLLPRLAGFAQSHELTGLEFTQGIPGSLGGAVTMNAGAYGGEMSRVVVSTTCLEPEGSVVVLKGEEHQFSYRHSAFSDGDRLVLEVRLRLERGDPAAIRDRMAELAARRREKQPLEYPSGGSTFKRPEGHYAAALIDGCGLKGLTVGGAQVSVKHAGFVVNTGGAACKDILTLVEQIRERVFRETGVELELEIKYLG